MSNDNGEVQIKGLIQKMQGFELQNNYVFYLVGVTKILMSEGGLLVLPNGDQM